MGDVVCIVILVGVGVNGDREGDREDNKEVSKVEVGCSREDTNRVLKTSNKITRARKVKSHVKRTDIKWCKKL